MIVFAQIGFFLLTGIFYFLLYREFRLAMPKTSLSTEQQKKFVRNFLIVVIGWAVFIYGWSRFGMFSNFDLFPVNVIPVMAFPLIMVVIFSFSKTVKELLTRIPQVNLVKLQVFRFYVEILLWALFMANVLPVQMTFEGRNFDILTGITAALLTAQLPKFVFGGMIFNKLSRFAIIAWNIIGLGLLINIVVIAILSMPTPLRYFMNEPSNTLVAQFPFILLPGILVPIAYSFHIFSLRQLLLKK